MVEVENRHRVVGVLCAKLKLHKITPNTQGIRRYDVMISGEFQSLVLPLILREVELNHRYEFSGSCKIAITSQGVLRQQKS